ncbi:MAG TPA: decaprenyl-phosphate phosphoribosyltransferase [Thermodesulfovibrionia bacterium]|nr:decaprenyl-phosphate phosphoribosyltransferase [Thermodesulfovibrionia bacterium]
MVQQFIALIESLRPRQWVKNLFVFAGLLFSLNILNLPFLFKTTLAFFIFCVLSGAVYLLNDLADREKDSHHPVKSKRPIASGRLPAGYAKAAFVFFTVSSLVLAYFLNLQFFLVALLYFTLQVAYTFRLKNLVILDVFSIAFGFVLRVAAGAVVISVEISSWLLTCTILLALFLGLSKRRHELVTLEGAAKKHRKVLRKYSPYLLDQMISVVTSSTVVAYALYTMSEETVAKLGTKNLIFTLPFVIYGIFRYLYLIHQKGEGGNPENILVKDKALMINILLWVFVVSLILYAR